jgi:hypothetical protein
MGIGLAREQIVDERETNLNRVRVWGHSSSYETTLEGKGGTDQPFTNKNLTRSIYLLLQEETIKMLGSNPNYVEEKLLHDGQSRRSKDDYIL